MKIIQDIDYTYDYGKGTHEVLLSGSVGSSKSILLAHLAVRHCLKYQRSRVLVGRRSTTDLRLTIWKKILEHMEGALVEGKDFTINLTRLEITFSNKSEIICRSWADGQYLKLRSLELSAAIIEELTESEGEDKNAYDEIKMRVGRLPHVKENWMVSATNPGDPSFWGYKYFIEQKTHPTRHVYYSVTTDNPYLPPQYIEQLKSDLDPNMARRMIYGEWLSIQGQVVYYSYNREKNFKNETYTVDPKFPILLAWDFNIASGKPMSMVCLQYIDGIFHAFNEVIIDGARTADTIDELDSKSILVKNWRYKICGDAAGKHRDTRQGRSDYDIIISELSKRGLTFEFCVPPSNPAVRNRHNKVNSYCLNALGQCRLFVYKDALTLDEGLRLTKLREGAQYVEDDTKRYQHVTTALGYAIMFETMQENRMQQGTIQL